jgi:hypothetical protein
MPFSSDFVLNPNARRQALGRAAPLVRPLSDPDRDFLEYKSQQLQAPGYISDDYARTLDLLNQNNRLTKGQSAIRGPAMLGLSRSAGGGGSPYGGGGPGEIPDSIALNSLLADKTFGFQQLALEDAVQARQERASALMSPTASQLLHSGQTAADQRAAGDIMRDESIRNATAKGTAAAQEYLAPGQADARRQLLWDQQRSQQTLYPYTPQAGRYAGQMGAAEQAALARMYQADAAERARVTGSALGAYGRLGGYMGMTPEEQERLVRLESGLAPYVGAPQPPPYQRPGQPVLPSGGPWGSMPAGGYNIPNAPLSTPQPFAPPGEPPQAGERRGYGPGGGQGRTFPAAMVDAYAQENGMTPQQAREFIERIQGYRIQ